jgi:hypothetical protein
MQLMYNAAEFIGFVGAIICKLRNWDRGVSAVTFELRAIAADAAVKEKPKVLPLR